MHKGRGFGITDLAMNGAEDAFREVAHTAVWRHVLEGKKGTDLFSHRPVREIDK